MSESVTLKRAERHQSSSQNFYCSARPARWTQSPHCMRIIVAARAYEARERQSQITDDLVEPRFEDLPPQELAASTDRNRDMESETPDE